MTQQKSMKDNGQTSKTDVIKLLTADHQKVKKLFKEFKGLKDEKNNSAKKAEIVKQICLELTTHAKAEEKIFYPAVRKAIKDKDLMDEADVEHAGAKELIAQLRTMSPEESHYDAKVTVLSEYVKHHVKEEESEMFPMIKKTKLDRQMLGEEISIFKDELKDKMKLASKTSKKTSTEAAKNKRPQK